MHSSTLDAIKEYLPLATDTNQKLQFESMFYMSTEIVIDPFLRATKTIQRFEMENQRFVTFEKKDLEMCIYFGWGKYKKEYIWGDIIAINAYNTYTKSLSIT